MGDLPQWYRSLRGRRLLSELDAVFAGCTEHVFGRYALVLECGATGARSGLGFAAYATVDRVVRMGPGGGDVRARCEALPVKKGEVSLVVAWHALECGGDAGAILDECTRVLAPDGHLIIVAFNALHLTPRGVHPLNLLRLRINLSRRGFVSASEHCLGAPFARYSYMKAVRGRGAPGLWSRLLCRVVVLHMCKREAAPTPPPLYAKTVVEASPAS